MSRRHSLIGASKPYLYKEEDAEFYYRQTSGGVIMNNSPLVGSIDRIKGQTIAWNQLIKNNELTDRTYWRMVAGTYELVNNKAIANFTKMSQRFATTAYMNYALHKYYCSITATSQTAITCAIEISASWVRVTKNLEANVKQKISGILSQNKSTVDTGYIQYYPLPFIDSEITFEEPHCIDLTLIYGEGNEPSTPEEFEADYLRWFGKPLTYEPYDAGSLRNVQMEGIKTTFTNASPQTRYFDVTSITGKLNGEGESVVIFPDGMKGVNDVKDEIYIEDGVTKAVKRIGRVDLGSVNWSVANGESSVKYFSTPRNSISVKRVENNAKITTAKASRYYLCAAAGIFYMKPNNFTPFDDGIIAVSSDEEIRILDTKFSFDSTGASQLKTSLNGVYLDYELAEPQVYVLDTPLPIAYNCEAGGTEQILPEEIGTGIAPIMDIKYKAGNVAEKPWYGIKWSEDNGQMQRIASNMELHATLPIQSNMKRCMLLDNGSVYKYISDADPFLYEDGTSVKYDGTDGQVMVEVPAYWYTAYKETDENNITWNYLKLYPEGGGQRYSRKIYRGAFEMITDNSDNSIAKGCSVSMLDFSSMNTTKDTTSFVASNMQYLSAATSYRNWNYANVDATDVKNSLGKPTTNRNRATFRGIAARRGAGFSQEYWDSYNSLIRLYVVEYCNFNIQANINESLTVEGFKQGGLDAGVTNANSTKWSNFNSYNPFVPCGVTVPLGNKSGAISYAFTNDNFDDVSITYSIPSYRGIENPFGHIYKFIDGFNRKGKVENDVTTEMIYVCDTISKFAENDADGYVLQSDTTPRASGSFGGVDWDAKGTFWPKLRGRTMYSDYFYNSYANNTWYTLYGGGVAKHGSSAGLFYLYAGSGSGDAGASVGSRLLFTK